jgi:hypothetical protein
VPNFWSDDYEAEMREPNWSLDGRFSVPGAKVLIFHPVHVALNSTRAREYAELKANTPALAEWSEDLIASSRSGGEGAGTLFEELASRLGDAGGGRPLTALIPA